MLKRCLLIAISALLLFSVAPLKQASALSGDDFQAGRIIDDSKFFTRPTMSINDIQRFLDSKVPVCDTMGTQEKSPGVTRAQYSVQNGIYAPFTCLKDARDGVQAKVSESGLCNSMAPGSGTAAEIIYWVSDACSINPQVLIVLLQKEQSLVTDDWPWPIQYRSATGYGCPDTAPCDSQYYGLFNQLYNAARQFKRYSRDSNLFNFRANANNLIQYNPNVSCGSSVVYIQNQATAGLYNYTPYQPNTAALNNLYGTGDACSAYGNRNFWRLFNDWFGSTYGPPDLSCRSTASGANVVGQSSGAKVFGNKLRAGAIDSLSLGVLNNTGTGCVEIHTWTSNFQGWLSHIATNRPAANPADSDIIAADLDGDGRDNMILVEYRNTSTGMIQLHQWDDSYQRFSMHIATNRPAIDPADSDIIAADANGDGKDEIYLIQYRNTVSGKVEIHGWSSNFQSWVSHVATNYSAVDPAKNRVIAADVDGNKYARFFIVNYMDTVSGKVEIHGWSSNFQSWVSHVATNYSAVDPGIAMVTVAEITGDRKDDILLVQYQNTTTGKIEIHGWTPNFQSWFLHSAATP